MDHARGRAVACEQVEEVVVGAYTMQDEWEFKRRGELDLGDEDRLLALAIHLEGVIKTAFTDGSDGCAPACESALKVLKQPFIRGWIQSWHGEGVDPEAEIQLDAEIFFFTFTDMHI